jgi:hypothetical protein
MNSVYDVPAAVPPNVEPSDSALDLQADGTEVVVVVVAGDEVDVVDVVVVDELW